ncbi:MAG: crossover junction endodeoxyribonuclease RuvC [Candidatus Shikimatogenerans bostrichidophilus]|nr:MAG: crossover junction endodeoxyribonuclease RuvC [Candidatus Shikimatogenerans bostrichidophilus]
MKNYIIMGIDPGINIIGISVIKVIKNKIEIIKLKEIFLKYKKEYIKKIKIIYIYIDKIIKKYKPNTIVMENTYYGKNLMSLRRLIECQSIILLSALHNKKKVFKYYPKTIKYVIAGNGNVCKKYIYNMIKKKFKIKKKYSKYLDIYDSIAVSLCHIYINLYNKLK